MRHEVDVRLVRLLRASLGLADALRDIGVNGDISVKLNRESGLSVLQLVSGSQEAGAEAFSQRNRPVSHEANSLAVAGLTFNWPKRGRTVEMRPCNDNGTAPVLTHFFEEEAPAHR